MMRDDFDQVDIDAPIPYSLTAKGRRDLELAIADELVDNCQHDWRVDLHRGLVCRNCDTETRPRALGSIPAYLGPKERR